MEGVNKNKLLKELSTYDPDLIADVVDRVLQEKEDYERRKREEYLKKIKKYIPTLISFPELENEELKKLLEYLESGEYEIHKVKKPWKLSNYLRSILSIVGFGAAVLVFLLLKITFWG